jgi:hypothetical protein
MYNEYPSAVVEGRADARQRTGGMFLNGKGMKEAYGMRRHRDLQV